MSRHDPVFSADLHLGHANCIRYCNRPFLDAHAMNKGLIDNWNQIVSSDDDVYLVGDVSFTSLDRTVMMLRMMHGRKFLVAGNHDAKLRKQKDFSECFEWIKDYHELAVPAVDVPGGQQHIVLCHFPLLSWNRSRYGSWMVHGHTHGNIADKNQGIKRYDCGVDCNNYFPIRYERLKEIMADRETSDQ